MAGFKPGTKAFSTEVAGGFGNGFKTGSSKVSRIGNASVSRLAANQF
jgi:hypothetical protein